MDVSNANPVLFKSSGQKPAGGRQRNVPIVEDDEVSLQLTRPGSEFSVMEEH